MWSGASSASLSESRGSAVLLALGALAVASVAVLALEARRVARPLAWAALSGGVGTSANAGVGEGWFLFDARMESQRDGQLGPLPGVPSSDGAGVAGGLEHSPLVRRPPR